jgi:hypothetical protein
MLSGGGFGAVGQLAGFPIKLIYKSQGEDVAEIFHEWKRDFCIIEIVALKLGYFILHYFCFL